MKNFFNKHIFRVLLAFCLLAGMTPFASTAQITYYSKSTGNANTPGTWGINTDGTGASPADFVTGDIFIVRSGSVLTTSGTWDIDDAGIDNAGILRIVTGGKLTAGHAISFTSSSSTGTLFEVESGGLYVHALATNISTSILSATITNFLPGSTFEISTTGSHTNAVAAVFANFSVSGTAVATITNTTLYVSEILTIGSAATLRFSNTGITSSLADGGSMTTAGSGLLRTASSSTVNLPAGITWNFQVNYDRTTTGNQPIQPGTYSILNTTGGNRSVITGGLVTIAGTFTPGAGTYTMGTNSTIEYSANGSLTIPALPYQNLTISGTGTKTLGANLTIAGTLNISNTSGFLSLNGNTLTLNGDATLTNGKLIGSSSSNLTVSGSGGTNAGIGFSQSGTNNQLGTFTLNRSSGGALLLDNVNIVSALVITAGNLNTNNNTLGLLSTGISSTARVSPVTGSISYGSSGGIRVERFIPSGFRSYRDLSPGVQTFNSSIFTNWQENGSAPSGYGTHITGVAGSPGVDVNTGLDKTQSGNATMFTYNGSTYPTVTNTASTQMDPYRGYRILIRGDRNVNLLQSPTPTTMNTSTVLRATGKLIYGDVNYSTSGVSNGVHASSFALTSSSATGFSLIGNPYASPVSWGKVLDNAGTANVQSTYWYFDPTLGINGIYATWIRTGGTGSESGSSNGIGSTNNFIQPGQAIFIRNNSSTSPAIQFKESNKATGSSAVGVFSTPADPLPLNKIGIILHRFITGRGNVIMDGSTVLFGSNNSNEILTTEDAGKITNGSENLAIVNSTNSTSLLSIESRKELTQNDSVPLRIWQVNNNTAYTLNLILKAFSANGRLVFLEDRFLNTQTYLKENTDTLKVPFTTLSTDSASFFTRFAIISKQPVTIVPASQLVTLTATHTGPSIGLTWKAENDINNLFFDLEKSTNGVEYSTVARIYSDGTGAYQYTDAALTPGKIYYRVKTFLRDAGNWNSNIALIETDNKIDFLSVYPNPVTNNTVNIQMNTIAAGNYQVALISPEGKILFTQIISHNGISATQSIRFNRTYMSGVYRLQLVHSDSKKRYSSKIMIAN